jgi:hypothetical protein
VNALEVNRYTSAWRAGMNNNQLRAVRLRDAGRHG